VAKNQIAKRVDETGDQRHGDQQRRQRTMLDLTTRNERLADFREESIHKNKHSCS
jgi:hypothetical protein